MAPYRGPWDCLRSIHQSHGVRGCFRGLSATIWREIPGFAVYMASYEYMCEKLVKKAKEKDRTFTISLLAGGIAGTLSWACNIPLDVVKSRLQSDDLGRPRYGSTWHCFARCYREEGWRVFFRGLPVICVRAFPTNAVTLTVYTSTMCFLTDLYHGKDDKQAP